MLARVTDLFDDEVNTTVESLTASLEPLLIVAMGVIVGAILLSVYLPMFRAIDLVK
jgi:type IV pilus assembly protein PilC